MKAAFVMTWRGLWRGKTLWTLLAAVIAAHFLLPGLVRSDGTPAGMCEMHLRVVFGAVAALIYVSSLAIACGSFARDREDDLLPLSLVRPVPAFSIAAGRWLAFTALMAIALAANAILAVAILPGTGYAPGSCRTHHAPALPPAEVTAAAMMEQFLNSDKTPEAVKKAPRAAVLALLTSCGLANKGDSGSKKTDDVPVSQDAVVTSLTAKKLFSFENEVSDLYESALVYRQDEKKA